MRKFAWLTFITGLLLSGIAAYFSVVGLSMIFAGSFWAVAVLASALEITKLVAVTWLYRYRNLASRPVRSYFYLATIVLMIITSLGIFGYLSRAHVDIEAGATNAQLTIDEINQREQAITDQRDQLTAELKSVSGQSDKLVDQLALSNRLTRANGAVQVQRENAKRRDDILAQLKASNAALTEIKKERITTQATVDKATADIGPLKYVASAVYGSETQDTIRKAVIWLTVLLMVVFDPMAVMLLIAANILFIKLAEEKNQSGQNSGQNSEIIPLDTGAIDAPDAEIKTPIRRTIKRTKKRTQDKTTDDIVALEPVSPAKPEPVLAPTAVPADNPITMKAKPINAVIPSSHTTHLPKSLAPEVVIKRAREAGWAKNDFIKKQAAALIDSEK